MVKINQKDCKIVTVHRDFSRKVILPLKTDRRELLMRHGEKKGITTLSPMERAKQAIYRAELGQYLKDLRKESKMSTRAVGEKLNVSSNYISEIERGIKAPADQTIREFAEVYGVDEDILFEKLRRIPLKATELLETHKRMQSLLSDIQDSDLSKDEQEQLVYIMETTFNKYMENREEGKQQRDAYNRFLPKVK